VQLIDHGHEFRGERIFLGGNLQIQDAVDFLGKVSRFLDVIYAMQQRGNARDDGDGVGALIHRHQIAGGFFLQVIDGGFNAGQLGLFAVILFLEGIIGYHQTQANQAQHFPHLFDRLIDSQI